MAKEIHEIWVNKDGSFDCESHGIEGEKCIEQLRKILEGLAEIEEFEPKPEFEERRRKGLRKNTKREQNQGAG